MGPLALVLHLALASPGLAPSLDPGPFQGSEIVGASLGAIGGDVLVLGAGYATLQLFANGTLDPTATNFRRAAYALGVSAILVPPVTAVLLARWLRAEPASGATWKALLLAAAGQFAALAAGIIAAPHFWIVLPVQVIAIGLGTSLGLHWGPRARRAPDAAMGRARAEPLPAEATVSIPGLCADPALAGGAHVG